jgi:hypothetical protein
MDLKKEVKEIIKWAQESEENKKKAINMATALIALMNSNKELSDEKIEQVYGGSEVTIIPCSYSNGTGCSS